MCEDGKAILLEIIGSESPTKCHNSSERKVKVSLN